MGLETSTYVDGLNTSNPAATDGLSQADDHLRLLKSTIKNTFPNISAAVTATAAEINKLDGADVTTADLTKLGDVTASAAELNYSSGVTSSLQTQLDGKVETSVTISAGTGLTGGGTLEANRTISHDDTSSQASVTNSGNTFIQGITLDGFGHITAIASAASSALTVTSYDYDTSSGLNNANDTYGSIELSNGLIIKWGVDVQTGSIAERTVTFKDSSGTAADPFPNNCFAVITQIGDKYANDVDSRYFSSWDRDRSGFKTLTSSTIPTTLYIAIGN
jgi:hypothetical protein